MTYLISASLLSADTTKLGAEVEAVLNATADMIHLDVMDNHYVPNLTFGPLIGRALIAKYPQTKLDIHLMTNPVDELIKQFGVLGVKQISIHPEATLHLDRSLNLIRDYKCLAGLALNPATSPECICWCRHLLDFVLVMTVNPGFPGQKLIDQVIQKILWIKQHFPDLTIAVDGGVSSANITALATAGASVFIAGNAIFATPDYKQSILQLRRHLADSER